MTVRVRSSMLFVEGDELEVANIVVHEDFDKYVLLNDIALIKVWTIWLVIAIFVERKLNILAEFWSQTIYLF